MNAIILSLLMALPVITGSVPPKHVHGLLTIDTVYDPPIKTTLGELTMLATCNGKMFWLEATTPQTKRLLRRLHGLTVGMVKVELEVLYVGTYQNSSRQQLIPVYNLIALKKRKY